MGERVQLEKGIVVLLYNKDVSEWEDRTSSILTMCTAYYRGNFTGFDINFKGAERKFFYKRENVRLVNKIKNIDISKQDVFADSSLVDAIRLDQYEYGYYRIYLTQGTIFTKNIKLKENIYRNIFTYYGKLAEYAGAIADEDSPLFFLSQNYKRITPSFNSAIYDYLQGENKKNNDYDHLLVPFDFNQSQVKAITTALTNEISVIEGPPGTGKTQTILNLIANILYRGENCAVVSNNNTAIDNIYEKLDDEKLAFFSATLGRQKNVEDFFESNQNSELIDFLHLEEPSTQLFDANKFNELSLKMKKIQEIEVETSKLESELIDLENEQKHFVESISENIINTRLSSSDYIKLVTRLEKNKKIGFFERFRLSRKFKVKLSMVDVNIVLNNAEKLFYEKRVNEIKNMITKNQKFLDSNNKDLVSKKLKELSRTLFENYLRNHYTKNGFKSFNKDSYKKDFDDFLKRYPVVLSTTQSLLNNAPKGFTFDYLIIDEASQGDLLSSILAMSCAKNFVIVGDSRQLQQIDEERLFLKSEMLVKEFDIPEPYQYEANSVLSSVKSAVKDVPTTLLREHYRCAPDIINFCNKMFYNGELVAMTKNTGKHIEIIKTVPGNHARKNPNGSGLYNQREIDEIENILSSTKSQSIGVITPFRYQANLITKKYLSDRLEADTIHKFQGRQKEEVVLSFVVNTLEKEPGNIENRLYDFVTNNELLNVAISRGRNKVTAIVADKVYHSSNNIVSDFIKYAEYLYGSDVTKESNITSVFDYLYSEYTNILITKYKGKPNEHKTELLMCDLIMEILKQYNHIGFSMHTRLSKLVKVTSEFNDEEKQYILHPWTHVDFLFYNKLSKEKLFVLEVDGISYHEQDKKQTEHDNIKNRVLQANHVPIYRFKTNESKEKEKLTEIIKQYHY